MVLRTHGGIRTGEDTEDLRAFLLGLTGGPTVTNAVVLACGEHDEERPTWSYVEADPAAGLARRRCLQCASTVHLLDSQERWNHPPTWCCGRCGQSIAEVAAGLSVNDADEVEWVVVAARCVECGRLDGLTDMIPEPRPTAEVVGDL